MTDGAGAERKFRIALVLFGVLAVVIWFTVGSGTVLVSGRPVEVRLIPLLIVGMFVLRTWVAREANKIRRRREEDAEKLL